MKVSHRLLLAVIPAVLGVFLVAALAYWGEYGRTAPGWLVIVAGVTTVVSLVVTWRNTRFISERIEWLTRALPRGGSPDEIDVLATELERLNSEAATAQDEIRRREREASERVQEYAALLAECAATVGRQIDEVKLPLHILLENHFGLLNENQEEMLGAARQAADGATIELRRLEAIASLDQGALSLRHDLVHVADLLRGLRPLLTAEATRRKVEVTWDIEPGLPRVPGDRHRLLEAIELLLRHVVSHADPGVPIRITVTKTGGGIEIAIYHGLASMLGPDVALARRVIAAHGGTVELGPTRTGVVLKQAG